MNQKVRVRFAPSPTGFLHIGGVRTALFNYLFARKEKGFFLLRIEDTDRERSRIEFENEILNALKWLGLNWDGAIFRQSERLKIYQAASEALIEKGFAYRAQEEKGNAVKFKIQKRIIKFQDLVHGSIEFDGALLDDLVILKSDGFPTYHFACVVDDHEMEITHVIRGDDHISNTPRQVAIYEAFGWKPPQFAHLPLVFGQDRTPLSKRHGAIALTAYQKEGYLPEGILNYLALLGWSPGGDQEVLSLKNLIQQFSLEKSNKTNACFDQEKLKWINAEHIRQLSKQDYLKRVREFFCEMSFLNHPRFDEIVLLYKSRIHTFQEFSDQAAFFFSDKITFDSTAVQKYFKGENAKQYLTELQKTLAEEGDFSDPQALETLLRKTAERFDVNAGVLIHPVRIAISGRSVTPGLFEVMVLLGKEVVLRRLEYAIINFESFGG